MKMNSSQKALKNPELLSVHYTFDNIIGQSIEIKELIELAQRIALSDLSVLISGESGTGKELFAQAIHHASNRSNKPFVAINCGAISRDLVESELFGYTSGSFTGAHRSGKTGKVLAASGGTLFLDEIDSMPLDVQVKLLRAFSSKEITKIGGIDPIPIDIRIISATKENLLKKADAGSFRDDLYYRISNIILEIPPLRNRINDISLIVTNLVESIVAEKNLSNIKINDDFMEPLKYYFWRGNIRELQNIVSTAVALVDQDLTLTEGLLPKRILKAYLYKKNLSQFNQMNAQIKETEFSTSLKKNLELYEELIIKEALLKEKGNITRTAKRLNVSITSLYRKLEKFPNLKVTKDSG